MVNMNHDESRVDLRITRRNSLAIGSALASILLEGCKTHDRGRERIIIEFENAPNCYVAGTQILTPGGPITIEKLRPGDRVVVSEGKIKPILWVARRRYVRSEREAWPEAVRPVRISRGALGGGAPNEDLYVSQNHRLFLHGMLVRVADLIDGNAIALDSWSEWNNLEYFHLLVEGEHDIAMAQGVPSETLLFDPLVLRQFDNFQEIERLHLLQSGHVATPFAPVYDYGSHGRLAIIRSHLRSALAPFVDARNDVDKLRDVLMARRLGVWRRRAKSKRSISRIISSSDRDPRYVPASTRI
jgi:hypothetical protein